MPDPKQPIALGCRSEDVLAEFTSSILVAGHQGITELHLDAPAAERLAQRKELITALRGGAHIELSATARTFRQKDGMPNKRFLRHAPAHLPKLAASYVGMPFLVDHNVYEQSARMGTITASELSMHGGTGWASFVQTLHVVKPNAVISVLDGTLDRFSIGWSPAGGAVMCSVHKQDVRQRGSCSCWPGDVVVVDGASQIVEYEFQNAEGTEVSGVNAPAVKGTKIEDVRAALAAELGFEPHKENEPMSFPRLAAVLGLTALNAPDEDRAVTITEGLKRDKLATEQELDAALSRVRTLEKELADTKAASDKTQIDALLSQAYRDGKLKMLRDENGKATPSPRETRLRAIAKRDGVDALAAELAEMEAVVPVGQRVLTGDVREPERTRIGGGDDSLKRELAAVADDLGLKTEDVEAEAKRLGYGEV